MASALFEAQRSNPTATVAWTVKLYFPAFDALSAKTFYWSTAKNIELEDGNVYSQILNDIPKGRHQIGRGNDYAEFSAVNTDYSVYQAILPYQDLIEKAECTVSKCYQIDRDLWESDIEFFGFLKDFSLDDTDKTFKFTAYSDMSRPNFLVGNRILTRERCGTEFNTNGTGDPTIHICGWQTLQGGNATFCSKLLKGKDGCEAHNNTHRFYAVTGLNTATVTIVPPGGTGDGWDPSGGGPCFSDKAYVLMADWSLLPIHHVKKGGPETMGFDVFNNDELLPAEVLAAKRTMVSDAYQAKFDKASFEVRKQHLFYLGEATYAPVVALGTRLAQGLTPERKRGESALQSIQRLFEIMSVFSLQTSTGNYIVTDIHAKFFYMVHNRKIDPGFETV